MLMGLDEVRMQRVSWLWPGWIPRGKLVVLDGDPGVGKSTLSVDLAARLSVGSQMPDGSLLEGPEPVLLLSAEDSDSDTIKPRVLAAGGDPARVKVLKTMFSEELMEARSVQLDRDMSELADIVEEAGIGLVVIDVLSCYLGSRVNTHRDSEVRQALAPLARMAESTGAAILALRHLSKSGGTNALYRGQGSIAITGAARSVLLVGKDPSDLTGERRILVVAKSNLAAEPPAMAYRLVSHDTLDCAHVVWAGETRHRASDLLEPVGEEDEDASAFREALNFLEDVLADGPLPTMEVREKARKVGIRDRTVERARRKLGVISKPAPGGARNGWVMRLPRGGDGNQMKLDIPDELPGAESC